MSMRTKKHATQLQAIDIWKYSSIVDRMIAHGKKKYVRKLPRLVHYVIDWDRSSKHIRRSAKSLVVSYNVSILLSWKVSIST